MINWCSAITLNLYIEIHWIRALDTIDFTNLNNYVCAYLVLKRGYLNDI